MLKDTQLGHTTTEAAVAATSSVCLKSHNGKPTSVDIKLQLEEFTARSTSCITITTTYSLKSTAVDH